MSKKEPADLSDKATLFQAYVDLVNSERETIWARHNALLVANSLIVGALAISPAAFWTSKWAPLAMLGAGLLICIAWFLITMFGWSVMRRHAEVASDFVATHYKHLPNPFADPTYHWSSLLDSRPRALDDRHLHPHLCRAGLYPAVFGLGLKRRGSARPLASS